MKSQLTAIDHKSEGMKAALLYLLVLMASCGVSVSSGCSVGKDVMVATTPIQIALTDYTYNEDKQEYTPTMTARFQQPVPAVWRTIRARLDNKPPGPPGPPGTTQSAKQLCLNGILVSNPCRASFEFGYNYKLFYRTCFEYYREGLYRVAAEERFNSGGSGESCNFDGTTRNWYLTKIDEQRDAVNWTVVEDREVQKCGEPVRRFHRVETVIYKVQRGCVLNAKAQGCQPGVETCQPCGINQVLTNHDGLKFCINRTGECDVRLAGFQGCHVGYQVAKDGLKAAVSDDVNDNSSEVKGEHNAAAAAGGGGPRGEILVCEACPPNTFQPLYPDDTGSGFRSSCKPCPEYQEVTHWAGSSCSGCPAGHFPKNKIAPLDCTKCPPGTYSGGNARQCTKCTGGFYADQAGMSSCKKCPTEWRCLVPNKVLGRFATTPYRWDESGNPACPTLDGKSCWKSEPEGCNEKLKKLKEMLEKGTKIQALVCGPMHKKVWGYDGYNDFNHWCSITKTLFMQPGKKDVGASSCSDSNTQNKVASVPAAPTQQQKSQSKGTCDCCDMCKE